MHHLSEEETRHESVADYPLHPKVEDSTRHVMVVFNRQVVANTRRTKRVLEKGHPPVYYVPPEDVNRDFLVKSNRTSACEWKGQATYYSVIVNGKIAANAAWSYSQPTADFSCLADHIAFFPALMDECLVDKEKARPEPESFYGGWITHEVEWPPRQEK